MRGTLAVALRSVSGALLRWSAADLAVGRTAVESVRHVLVSGATTTVPFLVTFLVLGVVLDFVSNVLSPLVHVLMLLGLTGGREGMVAQAVTVVLLFVVVFVVGVLSESGPSLGARRRLGRLMEAVPGVGSVYSSFDRMSEAMLESGARSFREVKLIEFPHADVYSLAFQTSAVFDASTGGGSEEMLVLFVPLAPNPVMGGFMVCVPAHRVRDVDMTVQEAFQALVTSGVAMTETL